MENTEQTRTGLTESNVPTKKATSISEEDSKRITAIRFLLIVFVIFIHNNLNADDAIYYHLNFSEPAVITWIKYLICSLFGGATVPLFFLFAGFLQFSKDDSYPILLKKRAKNLLVPYVLWTLLGVLAFFYRAVDSSTFFFLPKSRKHSSRLEYTGLGEPVLVT